MSQNRETNEESFESSKFFEPPVEKEKTSHLMKGILSAFLLGSIIIFFISVSSSQSRWFRCPVCDGVIRNSGIIRHNSDELYEKTNISHILFGIGGSEKTWKNRRHYSELWWKPQVTRGFVWLDEKPKENDPWPENSPPYRVSEDSSRFKYTHKYGSPSAVRIARVVLESYRLGLQNVRWFVMGDDDTVFFTDNLISVLSKYDYNQMYYIGGNSESVEQNMIHSYDMAFGGAGFAISYPLVAQLVKVLDGCIDRYTYFYGSDERIKACVNEIGVTITKELGFHQVDIRGDAYGLLAAHPVAPLVSLHHLDAVKPLFPNGTQLESLKMLMSVYQADPGRTIQQSFCYDRKRNWSVSVSWGYTIQIYPSLLTAKELGTPLQTFKTWRSWSNKPFTFNTRPMSEEPCERPLVYFLDRVDDVREGETITSYKRFGPESGNDCNRSEYVPALAVHTISVSSSKMEPDEWLKAPRRQCCEIVNRKEGKRMDSVLQVRIRRCNPWETITPP